jgi:hypothetical protein
LACRSPPWFSRTRPLVFPDPVAHMCRYGRLNLGRLTARVPRNPVAWTPHGTTLQYSISSLDWLAQAGSVQRRMLTWAVLKPCGRHVDNLGSDTVVCKEALNRCLRAWRDVAGPTALVSRIHLWHRYPRRWTRTIPGSIQLLDDLIYALMRHTEPRATAVPVIRTPSRSVQ